MKLLITGASGFLGGVLVGTLKEEFPLRAVFRGTDPVDVPLGVEAVQASLSEVQDWANLLSGVSVIIHCAARVHVMSDQAVDTLAEYRLVNVRGTLRLADQAARAGVKRFIFISSIKVNGETTELGNPFRADDIPASQDPYGISKLEAERGLRELSDQTGMEIVIIRPPLVYGAGVKANFASMMQCIKRRIPLPLGGITTNRRSLVYIENLVDLIRLCVDHPKATNQTFLVSDDEDVSTTALLRKMAKALGCPARLVSFSPTLIKLAATLIGKPGVADRLCCSLQVDITKTKELLGWTPKFGLDEGLRRTAKSMVIGFNK